MQIFRPRVHEQGFVPPAGPAAPAIALATTVIGTGLSIASQVQQANAQAGMAGYQAQLARNRQMIADWQAQRAEQQGRVDEQQQRSKTAQVAGAQRAALASQGGDVNSGSPLDIAGDTARAGEFDARTIRSNAGLKAFGLHQQANEDCEAKPVTWEAMRRAFPVAQSFPANRHPLVAKTHGHRAHYR